MGILMLDSCVHLWAFVAVLFSDVSVARSLCPYSPSPSLPSSPFHSSQSVRFLSSVYSSLLLGLVVLLLQHQLGVVFLWNCMSL